MIEQFPQGFLQALGHNPDAMEHFFRLSHDERRQIISSARGAHSKEEMENIVDRI